MSDTPTIEDRIAVLEAESQELHDRGIVPASDVIYRPPLWSQNVAYSAADDRRLMSTLWPGVMGPSDLRVQPRQEGTNMSVDVLPGHVVVEGSEQQDQGNYLCALAERVNIPIGAAPATGSQRWDLVIARVLEPPTDPASWELQVVSVIDPGLTPVWTVPPSSYGLAGIPVPAGLNQITADRITDYRLLSRPASVGTCFTYQRSMGQNFGVGGTWSTWGRIVVPVPPYNQPVDIEVRVEGSYVASALTGGRCQLEAQALVDGGPGATGISTTLVDSVTTVNDPWRAFSRSCVVRGVTLRHPAQLAVWAQVRAFQGTLTVNYGTLILRITPSALLPLVETP